jgi:hypothetical protein
LVRVAEVAVEDAKQAKHTPQDKEPVRRLDLQLKLPIADEMKVRVLEWTLETLRESTSRHDMAHLSARRPAKVPELMQGELAGAEPKQRELLEAVLQVICLYK